jgi:hypothetical protein
MTDCDEHQHHLTEARKFNREWPGEPDTRWKHQTFIDPWSLEDLVTLAPTLAVPPLELPAIEHDIENCLRKPLWKIEREAEQCRQQHFNVRIQIMEAGCNNPAIVAKGKMVKRQMAHLENINDFSVEMARRRDA